eukprot:6209623-Pleurochrysis_carterae.AAC.3
MAALIEFERARRVGANALGALASKGRRWRRRWRVKVVISWRLWCVGGHSDDWLDRCLTGWRSRRSSVLKSFFCLALRIDLLKGFDGASTAVANRAEVLPPSVNLANAPLP